MDEVSVTGSPFHDMLGFQVEEWREGFVQVSCEVRTDLLNRSLILHGGVLLTLMDQTGGLCGVWVPPGQPPRRSITVSLSGNFTGQVTAGRVIATGRMVSAGRSLYHSRSEVHGPDGTLAAFAASTHRWRGGHGPAGT